jgi:hypothetical protein
MMKNILSHCRGYFLYILDADGELNFHPHFAQHSSEYPSFVDESPSATVARTQLVDICYSCKRLLLDSYRKCGHYASAFWRIWLEYTFHGDVR